MKITIPVSVGELLDKISILEIKSLFTNNEYIKKELEELNRIKRTLSQYTLEHETQLKSVNQKLWEIEDRIRDKEKLQEFDDEFIELARSVYKNNDERARIKRDINEMCGSDYREIKLYG
jgi:chromosome condensin MukBEF ATPase and DNA-binding subunit MukB